MKQSKKTKLGIGIAALGAAVLMSSCTQNFCSDIDKAAMAYPYDQGVTVYVSSQAEAAEAGYGALAWQVYAENPNLWAYIPLNAEGKYSAAKSQYLQNNIIDQAVNNGLRAPAEIFFKKMDQKVLDAVLTASGVDKATITATELNPFKFAEGVTGHKNYEAADVDAVSQDIVVNSTSILRSYGYLKFYGVEGSEVLWSNYDKWVNEIEFEIGSINAGSSDYHNLYKNTINGIIANRRSCITTREGAFGHYGNHSNWSVSITTKSWGDAWNKGFIEGLIEYPIAWLVDQMTYAFDASLSGVGQILAIVLVTIIVRLLVMGVMFKSTLDSQKMQALQPQLAKIQAKYPNSNTNQAERQRLSQEQAALYKRNKINPLSSLLVMIPQMIFFFGVWGALQGSAVLSSGAFLNMRLSDTIQQVLFTAGSEGWAANSTGWWTALVLYILMAGAQFVSMKLPQWIQKKRTKGIAKTTANPALDKTQRTTKWITYGMFAFTVIIGFSLPSAMGVYWFIGAIMSIAQTLITQLVINLKGKKKNPNVIDYTK